jgi:hypothetical protein
VDWIYGLRREARSLFVFIPVHRPGFQQIGRTGSPDATNIGGFFFSPKKLRRTGKYG